MHGHFSGLLTITWACLTCSSAPAVTVYLPQLFVISKKPAQGLTPLSDHTSLLHSCRPQNVHSLLLVTFTWQIVLYSLMIFLLLFYCISILVLFINFCYLLFSLRLRELNLLRSKTIHAWDFISSIGFIYVSGALTDWSISSYQVGPCWQGMTLQKHI